MSALTVVATLGEKLLPVLVLDGRFTPALYLVVWAFWLLSLLALVILWRRGPHNVLDLWLMVVMCAWLFDMALSAGFNASRFDVGWYGGRMYGLLAASSLLIVLLIEAGMHYARLAQLSAELSVANGALEQLSLHDGLTGLPNRRFFDTYLAAQIGAARRYKRRLALVLCDIDSFKPYNDHYGHQAGDECLKEVAAALRSCCRRPGDMAARYGGEEFALILPDSDLNGATRIAEAARDAIAELRIPHAYSLVAPYVSISAGVAILLANNDAEQLITAADQTLFLAKKSGRAVARLNIAHAHSPAASYVSISGGVAALLGKGDRTAQQLIAEPTKACSRRSTRAAIGWFLNRPRWHEAVVRAVRDEGR